MGILLGNKMGSYDLVSTKIGVVVFGSRWEYVKYIEWCEWMAIYMSLYINIYHNMMHIHRDVFSVSHIIQMKPNDKKRYALLPNHIRSIYISRSMINTVRIGTNMQNIGNALISQLVHWHSFAFFRFFLWAVFRSRCHRARYICPSVSPPDRNSAADTQWPKCPQREKERVAHKIRTVVVHWSNPTKYLCFMNVFFSWWFSRFIFSVNLSNSHTDALLNDDMVIGIIVVDTMHFHSYFYLSSRFISLLVFFAYPYDRYSANLGTH